MAKKDAGKKGKKKEETAEADGAEGGGGGKKKLIIIIALAVLVLAGGGGGAAFFLLGGEKAPADAESAAAEEQVEQKTVTRGDPRYVDLDPDFTINMDADDNVRFVQIAVSLLTYFDETEEAIKHNLPILRNNIILMVGRRSSEELATPQGKESLQQEIHDEIVELLSDLSGTGAAEIERVYFTKFVMQ